MPTRSERCGCARGVCCVQGREYQLGCCAAFLVNRDMVLRWPKSFYEYLFNLSYHGVREGLTLFNKFRAVGGLGDGCALLGNTGMPIPWSMLLSRMLLPSLSADTLPMIGCMPLALS